MTAGGGIFLRGDITTAAHDVTSGGNTTEDVGDIDFKSLVEINASSVTIDTSDGSGGTVDFDSTINSTGDNGALTISSGGGAVAIDAAIGGEANDHLDGLTINASGTGAITVAAIGDDTEKGVDGGNVAIGNDTTTLVTLSGADYHANGSITVKATSATGGNQGENIKFTAGALTEG